MSWFSSLNTGEMTLELVLTALFIGVSAAIIVSLYNKRVPGELIRRLKACKALSPETAVTLRTLGYSDSIIIGYALRRSGTLRRVVCAYDAEAAKIRRAEDKASANGESTLADADADPVIKPESKSSETNKSPDSSLRQDNSSRISGKRYPTVRENIEKMKFYIPKKAFEKAAAIYPDKKGSVLGSVIAIIAFGAVMIGVYYAVPELIQLIKNFLNILSGGL